MIKKNKIKANGTAPIYLRITIDGVPKEISSKRYIKPDKWDNKLQKVSGNSPEVKAINSYLKTLEQEVYDAHHAVMKDKEHATSSILKSRILKIEEKTRTLVPIFQDLNYAANLFPTIITLLRNGAMNSMQFKAELTLVKNQNVDITNFEEKINQFKEGFARNYDLALENFKPLLMK